MICNHISENIHYLLTNQIAGNDKSEVKLMSRHSCKGHPTFLFWGDKNIIHTLFKVMCEYNVDDYCSLFPYHHIERENSPPVNYISILFTQLVIISIFCNYIHYKLQQTQFYISVTISVLQDSPSCFQNEHSGYCCWQFVL